MGTKNNGRQNSKGAKQIGKSNKDIRSEDCRTASDIVLLGQGVSIYITKNSNIHGCLLALGGRRWEGGILFLFL